MGSRTGSIEALLLGALSIAVLHALIPSHWLSFAVVGRAQRWTPRRTLTITALAGLGHVLMTILLGCVLTFVGKGVLKAIPPAMEHGVTAMALILLGIYFAFPGLRGRKGCQHSHHHDYPLETHTAKNEEETHPTSNVKTPTAMGALIMGLTLSPCLDLLPVYLAAAAQPWRVSLLISVIMALTTLSVMVGLVYFTLRGLERLNLHWLEHNEGLAVGVVLVGLGFLLFFI